MADPADELAPADWMLLADSSLAALLRTLADNPDPDTVAAAIGQGALSAFRPIFTAIGFIHLDRQVLALVGRPAGTPAPTPPCRWTPTSRPPSATGGTRS